MLTANSTLTDLDVSDNRKGAGLDGPAKFVKELAIGLRNNRALSSVNVLFNNIGTEQAWALANILKEHATLKSLCGNTGNETELDMNGKMHGVGDAIMLVAEIIDNRAMTSLNLASSKLGVEGAKILAACLPKCT
jgi:hypothetical protein